MLPLKLWTSNEDVLIGFRTHDNTNWSLVYSWSPQAIEVLARYWKQVVSVQVAGNLSYQLRACQERLSSADPNCKEAARPDMDSVTRRYIISLLRERWRLRQAGSKQKQDDMLDRIFIGIEVQLLRASLAWQTSLLFAAQGSRASPHQT